LSSSARWAVSAVLVIVGILALAVAVIYVTVPIHSLPGFIPGKRAVGGHYHKRGALVALVGIVLLALAIVLGWGVRRSSAAPVGSPRDSTGAQTPDSVEVPAPDGAVLEDAGSAGDAVSSSGVSPPEPG
jgi:type VI protein secretion system component VasK